MAMIAFTRRRQFMLVPHEAPPFHIITSVYCRSGLLQSHEVVLRFTAAGDKSLEGQGCVKV